MTPEVRPTRVKAGGPPARVALGLLVVGLSVVAGAGVLGREAGRGPDLPRPTFSPAAIAATPAARPSPPPESTPATAERSPSPVATPRPTYREGVAGVVTGTTRVLSEPRSLVRSGIQTLSPDPGAYWRTAVDGRDVAWALAGGRLARIDPPGGNGRTWVVDDDARFAANDITPSRAGGVWLVGTRTLRRFDGAGFREAVDVEADVAAAVEGPDGTLWAATTDGVVVHVAGSRRTAIDALRPNPEASISALAVDPAGDLWCAWVQFGGGWFVQGAWLARYDGTTWRAFGAGDAAPLGSAVRSLTALPDGSLWFVGEGGVARFDGRAWADLSSGEPFRRFVPDAAASGPGGTFWVAVGGRLGRFEGGSWKPFGSLAGLSTDGGISSVAPTTRGVFVAADGSIYRPSRDAWSRVWPAATRAGPAGGLLVAVSRAEAWAADGENVWHFAEGAWSGPSVPLAGGFVRAMVRAPDGTVWATTDDSGPYVLRGSAWTLASGGFGASSLALDADGRLWAAGPDPGSLVWTVRSFDRGGGTWTETARSPATDLVTWPVHLVVGPDGSAWVGTPGSWGIKPGLVHLVDGAWEMVRPRAGTGTIAIMDLAVAPDGDIWAVGADVKGPENHSTFAPYWVARFDGSGWSFHDAPGGESLGFESLAAGPDGTIWLATGTGLTRYDGTRWTTLYPGMWFGGVSVAPDGTVWVSGAAGIARLAPAVALP